MASFPDSGKLYFDSYSAFVGNNTEKSKFSACAGGTLFCALFIIGILAASGTFPGSAMGWTTVGIGGGYLLVKLLGGNLQNRKVDLLSSALLGALIVTFGALGASAILTPAQVGYLIIGTCGLAALSTCSLCAIAKRRVDQSLANVD